MPKDHAAVAATVVFLAVAALTGAAVVALPELLRLWTGSASPLVVTGLYLLPIALAVIAGWIAAKRVFRRLSAPGHSGGIGAAALASLLVLYVIGYGATWVVGGSAVQTEIVNECLATYHRFPNAREFGTIGGDVSPRRENYPRVWFNASFPLAPGLVAVHSGCQAAPLAGWGGWTLHLWYPGSTKKVGEWLGWLS